jgi:ankyrin repeat protein
MLASAGGHGRIVKLCLRKGAVINAQNAAGDTALLLAADAGHRAVAKHLLECGADPSYKNNRGESAGKLIMKWAVHAGAGQ